MQRQYHHPLEEGFEERIHTPVGVRSLVEDSHLMKLLRELDKDGFNVDGPLAELVEGDRVSRGMRRPANCGDRWHAPVLSPLRPTGMHTTHSPMGHT